ncbi:MAG: HAMP domain-containing histidine kinase [Deltaproteobacteria bacterium]|nr:HAMP domain-containing histidine kinase [Deltaproteobacteria bacterium]
MRKTGLFLHPIFIFVLSTLTLAASLFLYIYWYIGVSADLEAVIQRYRLDPSQFFEAKTWVVILILSVLVAVILVGIVIILIYDLKTVRLYGLQQSFINNFTHELKTPVTSLKLYLETFDRHEINRKDQQHYIGFMLQDIERLSSNINSILNLAKIESKVYEIKFTVVDVAEQIEQFLTQNRHIFDNCTIRIDKTPEEKLMGPVIVPLFDMLLMNILTNALKYNASEHPRIDITLKKDKKHIMICFRDNGIGIAKGDKKKIFKKFYQGCLRDEHIQSGGSGIGLYLVSQIARLHNGKIVADSEGPGKGSIFTLTLSCKQKETINDERNAEKTHSDY